jgi:hypothetical protein
MPVTIYYDDDADLGLIADKKVAILGYGSQGHAHALNLRSSGVDVRVGLREGSSSWAKAEAAGLRAATMADACAEADIIMVLLPDTEQAKAYKEWIEPNLRDGDSLAFAHGFNIHFGQVKPPKGVDVWMIAPKGPGPLVRRTYEEGGGGEGDDEQHGPLIGRRSARLEQKGRTGNSATSVPRGTPGRAVAGAPPQPPETSWGRALPAAIQGIIPRRREPTSSIGCCWPRRRSASKTGRPARFSMIHSRANSPVWISARILRISARVSSVTIRGPRVMSPYSAVSEIEYRMLAMPPS